MAERRSGAGRRRVDLENRELAAHNVRFRRLAVGALAAWAFIATVGIVSVVIQNARNTDALHQSAHALATSQRAIAHANTALVTVQMQQLQQHQQLVQGCERLNILRATANASSQASYDIDSLFFAAVRANHPKTRKQRRLTRKFLRIEATALRTMAWTPLTDCVNAVNTQGSAYKPPLPIPFAKQRPPASALSAANARLPNPVGSVP